MRRVKTSTLVSLFPNVTNSIDPPVTPDKAKSKDSESGLISLQLLGGNVTLISKCPIETDPRNYSKYEKISIVELPSIQGSWPKCVYRESSHPSPHRAPSTRPPSVAPSTRAFSAPSTRRCAKPLMLRVSRICTSVRSRLPASRGTSSVSPPRQPLRQPRTPLEPELTHRRRRLLAGTRKRITRRASGK